MITELVKKQKNYFEKKLINNAVFEKTERDVRNHRDIKLITNEATNNYLVSEPNYHTNIFFFKTKEKRKKKQIIINKPVLLGLSILEKILSKIVMYGIYVDIAKDVETRFDASSYNLDGPLAKG